MYHDDVLNGERLKKGSRGIKGSCLIAELKHFQPMASTNIDYMHSLLEGVVKRLFKLWFEENIPSVSIRSHMDLLNKRLMNIRPPSYVTTPPRPIFHWKLWRAHEFLSFNFLSSTLFLCFSVFFLKNVFQI